MAAKLSILNDPPKVLGGPQLLHQLIRWNQHEDSCAIDFTNNKHRQKYTYAETQTCVKALVSRIEDTLPRTAIQQSQHIIPILLPQSPGLYISQLAILESGGAFCPINLDAPQERIKFVVGDVAANIIITTSDFKDVVAWEGGPQVILVDEFPEVRNENQKTSKGHASREVTGDELAYVMYTSGSSGKPKGVAVSHLAASQSLLVHERLIPPFQRFLQFAAPSFDVSVFEIFFPLTRGCSLVGCNRTQLLNDLPGMINELEVDAAELTPTVAGSLLQKRTNAPCLKLLLTIGEMLTRPIVEEFGGSETKSSMLYGMYGPTEAAIHCTIFPAMEASTKPGNIGVPFETVSTFIAAASTSVEDAAQVKLLPIGELGELVLGGPQLANGYLNREEQNKLAFVECEGKKYYRTGDKARQLEDGTIEILGRISAGQVKLRGQRIELGEIEDAVYKHPGIKTAVAVVLRGSLIVFALVGDTTIKSDDVSKTCSRWLPKSMVPSEIVLLQSFPYLPSGKVDKRKLESDYQEAREKDDNESDDTSETEQTVRGILKEVLRHFHSNQRLAVAGLDSLTSIRVASRLRSSGFGVNTVSVLQADTLKSLVDLCEQVTINSTSPPLPKEAGHGTPDLSMALNGRAKDVESTMPCTPLQSAMLSETAADQKAYRNWVELKLPHLHDVNHVTASFLELARHNPILRTGFTESQESNGFNQFIWQNFPESNIEHVEELDFEFNISKDTSLHHPIRVQILIEESGIRLLLHIHHALYDAWSLELLLDDFDIILAGGSPGERPPFGHVVDGYSNGTLATDDWSSKDYWRDQLAYLELRQMPNFHTLKSSITGLKVSRLETSIITSEVEAAARKFSTSPQSIFQAAYSMVLGSYLGSSDICFGTVFSGRTLPVDGIEDIVGPCLATLPIRIDVSTSATLQDLAQELNTITRKHLEHSTIPLREIKNIAGVSPRQQLFDTLLIWQQTLHSYDHVRENVLLMESVDNLEFNLTLEIIPGAGNIELKANYQQALFPEAQINLLLRQLEGLVKVIVEESPFELQNAFQKLGNEVLSVENENPPVELRPNTLSSPVEKTADHYPTRVAITFAKSIGRDEVDLHEVTYSELNARSNQIGHQLLELNVLPNELVCICMEKCVDLYGSILATAKIGAGYLPLTPDVPAERLAHILQEAKVKVILAQTGSRTVLENFTSTKIIYIDKLDLSNFSAQNIPARSQPSQAAYCVFTSGSTGTPKGVLVTQGNLLSNLDVLEDLYPACSHARLLQSCSQAFDVSVFEIFFTWRIGGCLCSATKDVLFKDIENSIRQLNVTHLSLTPTVAALVDPKNVPNVEFLVTAGEAVTAKVFSAWAGHGLWQGYGPSETTNICTVNPRVSPGHGINSIGSVLKNTSLFILAQGPDFTIVPRGAEGELCFGGSQVFRGYIDKSQNAGKIIEHPTFGRIYRTGDFGRLLPDGSIIFTNRKDEQVKIRGQRVELGEITSIMLKSEEVEDCVTLVVGAKDDNSQRLVCFWTPFEVNTKSLRVLGPNSSSIKKIYESLESSLPAYMIPSALIPISFLPATSQGKIDKPALIQLFHNLEVNYLDSTSRAKEVSSTHTWTEMESTILNALAATIKSNPKDIGPNTSFFNVGIDSISAISLSRNLGEKLGLPVEISDILKYPSVVRLAERLSTKEVVVKSKETTADSLYTKNLDFGFDKAFVSSTTARFEQHGRIVERILPCTPLQEAMLSAADSSTEKLYANSVTFKIAGDVENIRACWQAMVRRHEILRTCFMSTDMPQCPFVQIVIKEHELKFTAVDSTQEIVQSTGEFEPPYSLHLVKSPNSNSLVISMHHALYDGVALSVLYAEVESLYKRETLPPAISFVPFLKAIVSFKSNESDKFWETQMKGVHVTRLPKIQQDNTTKTTRTHTRMQKIKVPTSLSWIEVNTKKHGTSLLAVSQAAWACVLSELLQETDICFGNVVNGRALPIDGIERLVAPCFNTIPIRLQNTHKASYLDTFRTFQSFNADSLPFHLTPLRRIQSKFSPDGSRLFDTLFILQQPAKDLDSSIWSILDDSGAMDFPLVCEVVPKQSDDTLEIILHSYTFVLSEEGGLKVLNSFGERLRDGLENPRRPLLSALIRDGILEKREKREKARRNATSTKSTLQAMSAEEIKLRDIISKFTDVAMEKIGWDISIFRLGLDSISTVQVASLLRKQGHAVMASDILEHPTIARLNSFLAQESGVTAFTQEYDFDAFDNQYRELVCSKNKLDSSIIEFVRPCTFVQQGMLAQTLHSSGQDYVNSIWFECLPGTDLLKIKEAWKSTIERHEMLRTGFVSSEDPKHPLVMITYKSFPLPWFEDVEDDWNSTFTAEKLASQTWSISQSTKNGLVILRFTAHHALYDAQSMQIILSDVAAEYGSRSCASTSPITSLLGPILQQTDEQLEAKKLFWSKEENKIVVNRFPDLTPLQIQTTTSTVKEISSSALTKELEDSCREIGVTMQAAAQASWARLLTAYIGETSTTFGMTLSGRSVSESADRVAFPSIVTLPVKCNVTGTNSELLSRTMESNALLHKHQFTPLTSIQKWGGYPEGKIFDTLFAYQKLPNSQEEVEFPWKVVREEASVDYAVSLEVQPSKSGEVVLRLTFREDLIPVEHAEILLKQYDALLLDTLRNPDAPCDEAPKLHIELISITAAEENELPGTISLLHEFVERGASEWANKTALQFATNLDRKGLESQSWSYSQLNQEANKVAHLLLQMGITPGEMIAICFDKCPEASFAIIGILKAGCAYVALDPNAPADRLKYIVGDSGAKLILTAGKPARNLAAILDTELIVLDTPDILRNCSTEQPQLSRKILPQDVSYCLYTSGTTGTPKGCLITHENTVQFMLAFSKLFAGHWTQDSKYLQFASFHFDVSVMEQFWSWSIGICVASAPRDLIFEDIAGAINALGITNIDLTPSLARLLRPEDVPTLCKGAFITGGEQLKQEILDVWGEHAVIYNGYGPTEATIGCTMYPRVPKNGKPANIGPAYCNAGSFVLKPGTEIPVLRGGIGELCVSGKLVGKGYLNRPELTAEKFPTLKAFGERVYRTGDLVRILHDGCFIFLGRVDDQVKLRGQRLELSEINQVIKKSLTVLEEVVTLVLKHATQQKEQLVTFFVVASSKSQDQDPGSLISTMKDACKSRLPGYMVPTHFIPIKALPLNANNKADSKQLATIYNEMSIEDLQKLNQSSQGEKQWDESETKIIEKIAKAMDVEITSLTRGSNIFELGLDSISIISFSRSLQNTGLANGKLSIVKANPGIGSLVKALLKDRPTDQGNENAYLAASQYITAFSQRHRVSICQELGVDSRQVESIAPCTPVQEGMIYRFLESEQALYFNTFKFKLGDQIDVEKLLDAWARVIGKLEVLRTKFVATDDGFAQIISKRSWKIRAIGYKSVEKHLALQMPFSLNISEDKKCLTLRIFHGLYDGNSLAMLLQRVVDEFYGVETIDYGPSFTSSLAYGPLAKLPDAEKFWASHLKNWTYQPMPIVSNSTQDVIVTRMLSSLEDFEDVRKQLGVTPQSVIQATWLSVLQTVLSSNLTIGIVTSGRAIDFPGADVVIGPLFNTVPCFTSMKPKITMAKLIRECHEFNMKMQDYQHTPLKEIQKWSPAKIGQALFDTLFVFQRPENDDVGGETGIWEMVDGEQIADYPLAFEANLSPDSEKLNLTLVAQGAFMDEKGAASLLDLFTKALRETLQEVGKNIIHVSGKVDHTIENTTLGLDGTADSDLPASSDGNFTWTKEALTIKKELAVLAGVAEEQIQANSSIFELGLDSIDVIKLSSRLKKQDIKIAVSAIIKSQTVAKIVEKISRKTNSAAAKHSSPIDEISQALTRYLESTEKLPKDAEAVFPATPLQQSIVNEIIHSNYERYFSVDAFKLGLEVEPKRLIEAIQSVVRKSPILRTTIVEIDDPSLPVSFAQIVHRDLGGSLRDTSVHRLSDEETLERFMSAFKAKAISLAIKSNELLQVRCFSAEDSNYLALAISHALYDGTSLRAIHEDIQRAYHGKLTTRPDFKPFLEEVFESTTDDAKRFWKTTLTNLPPTIFPRKEMSALQDPTSSIRIEKQSKISLEAVEAFCKSSKITLQTLGQTCWALVQSHLMGQLEVVFGSVLSCRDSEDANEVMFPLMNTVAVRSVLHGSLNEMLSYMQEMSDTTRQYQHFPLGTAQAYALASRHDGRSNKDTTLFDTLFIYQGRRQTTESGKLYDSIYGSSDVEFPVCVEMEVVDDKFINWTTKCKAIARDETETEGILGALEIVIQRVVEDSSAQAIVTEGDGISVCGLPKFKRRGQETEQISEEKIGVVGDKWSETELTLRTCLSEISGVPEESIKRDLTIFHLGLDSILVLKLPALLKKHGIKLNVSEILREQTIIGMAKAAQNSNSDIGTPLDVDSIISKSLSSLDLTSKLTELEKTTHHVQAIMPVLAGQLFMIRKWQATQGAMFHQTFTYSLPGPINKARLENSWKALLQRHDILRTGFFEINGTFVQVVYKSPPNEVIYNDDQPQDINSLLQKSKPGLSSPPLNLVVEDTNEETATLKIMIHHVLYDGISLPIFISEFQSLYRGASISEPPLNFRKFVAQSINPSSEVTRDKWKEYLAPAANATSPQPLGQHLSGKRTEVFHPKNAIKNVKNLAQSQGFSIDSLFLASVSKILAKRNSTDNIILGIYLANRAPFGEDLSSLAAPTLNLLPIFVKNPLNRELVDIAKDIQIDVQKISSKEMVRANLEEIWKWTGVKVDIWINILKSENPFQENGSSVDGEWSSVQDLGRRSEIVEEKVVKGMTVEIPRECEAYLPSTDIEMRYHTNEGEIDIGIFAPEEMLCIDDAGNFVESILEAWR